jgi:hypothetical protein
MNFVEQTKFEAAGQKNNSLAACFATLLNLQINAIPQFEEMDEATRNSTIEIWLRSLGYERCEPYSDNVLDYWILTGEADGIPHATIINSSVTIHNPHPEKIKITRPLDLIFVAKKDTNVPSKEQ